MKGAQHAEAAGFDLSLIEENLRCSFEQRVLQHQAASDLMLEIERIGRELRDGSHQTPAPPPGR